MVENYFPKNETEYCYYFGIESFSLAAKLNEERVDMVSSYRRFLKDKDEQLKDFVEKSELLGELFSQIISGRDINTIHDFYGTNNTCILLNCNIENVIDRNLFDKDVKKEIGKKTYRKWILKMPNIGDVIYPETLFVSTFRNHFPKLMLFTWLLAMVYLFAAIKVEQMGFGGIIILIFAVGVFEVLPMAFIDKISSMFHKGHLNQIKSEFSYKHQYQNRDFWSDVVENRIKKK